MSYEPGREPEELKKHVDHLLTELQEAFPDGLIIVDMWKHERWDRLVEYLIPRLGYDDNASFLKAYGFDLVGDLKTEKESNKLSRSADRESKKTLVCPNCGSDDVSIETFQESLGTTTVSKEKFKFKQAGHGLLWWLFIGWWWWTIDLCLWVFAFPIRLLLQVFKKKKYKGNATTVSQSINEVVYKKIFTCRSCGNSWSAEAGEGSTMSAISKSKNNIKQLKKNIRP